jgi:hypothetical protein
VSLKFRTVRCLVSRNFTQLCKTFL